MAEQIEVTLKNFVELAQVTSLTRTTEGCLAIADRLTKQEGEDPKELERVLFKLLTEALIESDKYHTLQGAVFFNRSPGVAHDKAEGFTPPPGVSYSPQNMKMLNAAIGLLIESHKTVEAVYSLIYMGRQVDAKVIIDRLAAIQWYVAEGCAAVSTPLEKVLSSLIDGLRGSFPDRFKTAEKIDLRETGSDMLDVFSDT